MSSIGGRPLPAFCCWFRSFCGPIPAGRHERQERCRAPRRADRRAPTAWRRTGPSPTCRTAPPPDCAIRTCRPASAAPSCRARRADRTAPAVRATACPALAADRLRPGRARADRRARTTTCRRSRTRSPESRVRRRSSRRASSDSASARRGGRRSCAAPAARASRRHRRRRIGALDDRGMRRERGLEGQRLERDAQGAVARGANVNLRRLTGCRDLLRARRRRRQREHQESRRCSNECHTGTQSISAPRKRGVTKALLIAPLALAHIECAIRLEDQRLRTAIAPPIICTAVTNAELTT